MTFLEWFGSIWEGKNWRRNRTILIALTAVSSLALGFCLFGSRCNFS